MTAPTITFYTHPMSRGRIARWMLQECGAAYDTVVLDYGTSMKAPEYLVINPMGKVPALKVGDAVVTEVAAICLHLADLFPAKNLAPAVGSGERGAYYRWIAFVAGPLESAVTAKALGTLAPIERRAMAGYGTYEDVMNTLDAALEGKDFIVGDHFTAADLLLAANLGWGLQFGTVEKRANFVRYATLHAARPAAVEARAIDDALMAAHPHHSQQKS